MLKYKPYVLFILILLIGPTNAHEIEINADDFISTKFLSIEQLSWIKKNKILKGSGEALYKINIPRTGWYELWVEATKWATDIFLDDELLIHTPFESGVWRNNDKEIKVMNLYLEEGQHSIRYGRQWFPGLPYLKKFSIRPSSDISGMVRVVPEKDYFVYRLKEEFPITLQAGKIRTSYKLEFKIRNSINKDSVNFFESSNLNEEKEFTVLVPKGSGLYEKRLFIPTDKEGVFDIEITDQSGRFVDRIVQFVVVDTFKTLKDNSTNKKLSKRLVCTIDTVKKAPDYLSDVKTNIRKTAVGSYRVSGDRGVYEHERDYDYFSYVLQIPSLNELYLIEVDFPDDTERTFTISLIEKAANPYAIDSGVTTGGQYSLSNKIQSTQIFFYSREKNPRLLFLNWRSGQRIAVSQIRLYKVTGELPILINYDSERQFGMYFEEPLRFTTYFGANPTGNEWTEIYKTAQRWAKWSTYIGINQWMQTIAHYQSMMWPSGIIPGYQNSDEDGYGIIGQGSLKDLRSKDIIRLLLLISEKHDIGFVGELGLQTIGSIRAGLDSRFGGKGFTKDNSVLTPWLIVSKRGEVGGESAFLPYLNPVHPDVQDWISDIVKELAESYKNYKSFHGLGIRLMGWSFSSWQAFPSINWGYGDYTINLFQQETGIRVPISPQDSNRFSKRFVWLMENFYDEWVNWRCNKVSMFFKQLKTIMMNARPDMKLFINAYGPDYSLSDWGQEGGWRARGRVLKIKGWHGLVRESGIDPFEFRSDPNIIFSNSSAYPAGIRAKGNDSLLWAKMQRQEAEALESIKISNKNVGNGSVHAVRFLNEYMEKDFPVEKVGIKNLIRKKQTVLRLAGAINPAGFHYLSRYTNALANGNITIMIDGGLGYVLGQPHYLTKFLQEYHALPNIGMSKLKTSSENVFLWYGKKEKKTYFYIVNNSDSPKTAKVLFSGEPNILRVTNNYKLELKQDGILKIKLEPYELISMVNISDYSFPIGILDVDN